MKIASLRKSILCAAGSLVAASIPVGAAYAQETVTAYTVVTADSQNKVFLTSVPKASVGLKAGGKRRPVSGWTPLRGDRSALELVILLDDSSAATISLQYPDIRRFIESQPPATRMALSYMRYGAAKLVHPFTSDHAAVIKDLRLPMGIPGGNASPFFCLSDLVNHWPPDGARHEVIMVTNGIDHYSSTLYYNPLDPYVLDTIHDVQKAGVILYTIYFSGTVGYERGLIGYTTGIDYSNQIATAAGGVSYIEGFANPVSFRPFLKDISRKLQNQYELSFSTKADKRLVPIHVTSFAPGIKLQAPERVAAIAAPPAEEPGDEIMRQ